MVTEMYALGAGFFSKPSTCVLHGSVVEMSADRNDSDGVDGCIDGNDDWR